MIESVYNIVLAFGKEGVICRAESCCSTREDKYNQTGCDDLQHYSATQYY